MKIKNVGIMLPYETVDGERAMMRFRFRGEIDRRGVRRALRRYLTPLGIRVDNQTLNFYIRNRSYDLGLEQA